MTGLRLADLRRNARRLETIAEMAERIARLEAAIKVMGERLQRLEATRANGARKDGEDGYEVASLIG